MNILISANKITILTVILALSGNVVAGTGHFSSPSSNTSNDADITVTIDTLDVTKTVGTFEQVMTVIKNEKLEVSGNLFGSLNSSGQDALSLSFQDSLVGNYGFLDISSGGDFRYVIKNDLPQVQALDFNDVAEETFHYQIKDSNGIKTDAILTIFILGNPSVSFDNVEIEFNNISAQATSVHAGSATQMGQNMRGQLTTPDDRDWFIFNSLGNEIINLELCPEGSQCVDEKAWVMYVFDADLLAQKGGEFETFPIRRYLEATNETLSTTQADHMYLLLNKGIFEESLIGVIDPCFGDRRTIDIGVGSASKNYLVSIGSPLLREDPEGGDCGSGDVIREEIITLPGGDKIIQEYLTAFPFSDDQYSFRVTRTGADPFAVIAPNSTTFDAIGRNIKVPKMRVNNELFSITLEELTVTSSNTPDTFGIQSTELLNEPLLADPYLPTYNSANQIIKIPQVVLPESGDIYSVEMQYLPGDGTLKLLKAEPVN